MTRAADRLIVCGADGETQAAGRLLVRSRARGARSRLRSTSQPTTATARSGAIARRRRRRSSARPPTAPADRRAADCRLAQRDAPRRAAAPVPLTPSQRLRRDGAGPCRRAARPAQGAGARRASCTGCCSRCRTSRRSAAREAARRLSRAQRTSSTDAERDEHRSAKSWRCSTIRVSPPCSRRQPRRGADRRPRWSPARQPLAVAGQVDRLVVTDDAVLIADYKTNRPAAAQLAEAPHRLCRASSRSTGRCWRNSTRTSPSAPPWSGPRP